MSCLQTLARSSLSIVVPCSCSCPPWIERVYRLAKPAFLPRPNRTLIGTNCSADMAFDRSSISRSGCCPALFSPCSAADWSSVDAAGFASGLVGSRPCRWAARVGRGAAAVVLDLRRRRPPPPSTSRDRRPSMPSRVTAKKKFLGYMCLSIRCILRFCGVLHFLSQPSTKHEYWDREGLVSRGAQWFAWVRLPPSPQGLDSDLRCARPALFSP